MIKVVCYYISHGPGSWLSSAWWSSLKGSHIIGARWWLGLASSQRLPHSHVRYWFWLLSEAVAETVNWNAYRWPLHVSSHYGSSVPRIVSRERELGKSCITLYDLTSEIRVTSTTFCWQKGHKSPPRFNGSVTDALYWSEKSKVAWSNEHVGWEILLQSSLENITCHSKFLSIMLNRCWLSGYKLFLLYEY